MKQRFTRLLLLGVVLLSTVSASAYDALVNGIYYNFNTNNKTASVTSGSKKYVGDIVIPSTITYNDETYSVTSIASYAFNNCSSLTSVIIPNSVTSIEYGAFHGCSSLPIIDGCRYADTYLVEPADKGLTAVNIKGGTRFIGGSAFDGCSSLVSITIPNSVTSIGNSAFSGCSNLTSITIPNSVISIGSGAFYGCNSLPVIDGCRYADTFLVEAVDKGITVVNIKDGTRFIDDAAFSGCSSMISVTIPNPVTNIGDYAFNGCSSLTSITIPNSVTRIGRYAFSGCRSLTSVTIPNSVTRIGNFAFLGCVSIKEVHTTDISAWCQIDFEEDSSNPTFFSHKLYLNATEIEKMAIPNSVTSIGNFAFLNCSRLTSITIPNSVMNIGSKAFSGCSRLTSITIPNSVTSVGSSAFNGCYLKDVMMNSVQPASTEETTFSDRTYQHASLYIPAGSWMDYVYDGNSYWYKFNKIYETAQSVQAAEQVKAYMLMDDKFGYAVYDPINDKVVNVSSTSVDGSNPNHAWMLAEVEGKKYLYNLGAKKFAVPSTDCTAFTLHEAAAPICATDGDNGIILNGHSETQWNLTDRAQMGGLDDFDQIVTAISTVNSNGANIAETYTLDGKRSTTPQRGIRVIRYSDGTTKKVM